jgi:hypothetical protein
VHRVSTPKSFNSGLVAEHEGLEPVGGGKFGSSKLRLLRTEKLILSYLLAAASSIRSAISLGCEIKDRWLDCSSIVFAFMRLARNRSNSGDIVMSFFDI